MTATRVHSVAFIGVEGHLLEIEAKIDANAGCGLPGFRVDGLPDAALCESKDRVRAGVVFPVKSACRTARCSGRRSGGA